ncbi:MAG TPA: hypothetical protein VFV50_13255, partial [Bdellovibrionales bacterium]|nr:hypothetical protein [Bdellovibrionales bacterium]
MGCSRALREHARHLLWIFFTAFTLGCAGDSAAANGAPATPATAATLKDTIRLNVNEADLRVVYGQYAEIEILAEPKNPATDPYEWSVTSDKLPPGLQLQDTSDKDMLLFGTPQFQGSWCFGLSVAQKKEVGTREICLFAQDNADLKYPKFKTDRFLPDGVVDQLYQQYIELDKKTVASTKLTGDVDKTELPKGLKAEFNALKFRMKISGRASKPAIARLGVKIQDGTVDTYKQFQIVVNLKPVSGGGESCPPGYYFDPTLGYCVQDQGDNCPPGTYYEPATNSCQPYPQPPPTIDCPAGYDFDSYLSRCVPKHSPRCPLNYEWDNWERRCVRKPYTCEPGYQYSWTQKECVWIWQTSCSYGYHWDSWERKCVRNYDYCRHGYTWDRHSQSCRPTKRCWSSDEYWEDYTRQCRRRDSRRCDIGE